ncbi:nose resistant to fluoxetine protein 6-like [Antedon mediterranea]|uniref:nose resistant to fluoxetine protein 6-like n=1 Tax=Antedon mediterranea TaxID=105859 RepID=UPI003AF75DFC
MDSLLPRMIQFILILAISSLCRGQPQLVLNEEDAMKFIAKQRYVNSYQAKAEELQAAVDKLILEPLMYSEVLEPEIDDFQTMASTKTQELTTTDMDTITATKNSSNMPTTAAVTYVTVYSTTMSIVTNSTKKNVTEIPTTMTTKHSTKCRRDLGTFQIDLLKEEHYALMMIDSYGKLPPGLLQGDFTYWFGLYDECLNQSRKIDDEKDNFKAEYCIAGLYGGKTKLPSIGICVPDSCSNSDLMEILGPKKPNSRLFVSYVKCNKVPEYSAAAIICLIFLSFFGLMIISGTIYDVLKRWRENGQDGFERLAEDHTGENSINGAPASSKEMSSHSHQTVKITKTSVGLFGNILLCFSLLINGSKILQTKQGEQSLGALNGIRVISLWWVMLGHTYIFALTLFSNLTKILEVLSRFTFQAVGNATFSVDSFFFLSGLLVTYLTLKYLQKHNGKLNWLMFFVHRYLRLTPVYAMVIFIFTTLAPHFANGPLYQSVFDPNAAPGEESQVSYCQKYWWTNLLYINNLYPSNLIEECVDWSWYLANDMQFYIISPFVIYLLYHYFFVGVAFWSALLITCFGSLIGISIKLDIYTGLIPQTPDQKTLGTQEIYVRPWTRISTYLVGMAIGYILYKYKNRVRMPQYVVIMGWMAATGIALAVVYGLYGNFHGDPLNEAASVAYITLSRFSWAVALAWVAFACVTGYGGPVNSLLSWSFWIPLSRINYCAYLLHPIIMFVFYYSLPNMIYFTDLLLVYFFIGNIVLSYAAAFILSVSIEAPFMALEKLLLNRDKSV